MANITLATPFLCQVAIYFKVLNSIMSLVSSNSENKDPGELSGRGSVTMRDDKLSKNDFSKRG